MLGNGFYRKMAAGNIRRSREVYLPYLLAAAIIGCVYFLVVSMSFAENLTGVPSGENARLMFAMGTVVFTIFAFCFLLSINRFLIKQRKKEFGLYGVLGLSKGHVGRILVWENAMVLLGGPMPGAGVCPDVRQAALFGPAQAYAQPPQPGFLPLAFGIPCGDRAVPGGVRMHLPI